MNYTKIGFMPYFPNKNGNKITYQTANQIFKKNPTVLF